MHALIIYAHPSEQSFSARIRDKVIETLRQAGHTWELSDLYRQNFVSDMCEAEYIREAFYKTDIPLPQDVKAEQEKILRSQTLIFIYPVFWTEAPAKLKGWFDRVWTVGFAYENCIMPHFDQVLFLVSAGNTQEHLKARGFEQAMKTIMCGDRIGTRAKKCEMHLFTETSRGMENREQLLPVYLEKIGRLVLSL